MTDYPKPVSARLLTYPHYPLETLFLIWEQSKHNRPVPMPQDVALINKTERLDFLPVFLDSFVSGYGTLDQFKAHYQEVVSKILREDVPCEEEIWFVFLIEDLPVALREQMYRHKVGTQVGPRIGFDIVPDLTESSFWAQSHRVLDMGHFFDEKQYFVPESIKKNWKMTSMIIGELDHGGFDGSPPEWGPSDLEVEEVFNYVLKTCQTGYAALVEAGVPPEDARNVLPFAVTHRTTWAINLKALAHVIGKRSCFTGDTKVALLAGEDRTLKELAEEGGTYDFYGCKRDGEIIPVKGTVSKTGLKQKLVEVELDNGEKIRCTPDHKWLCLDGKYRRAENLQPGQSLKPLYRRVVDGYEQVHLPKKAGRRRWTPTARMVMDYPAGDHVHHMDENKWNNVPENLEVLGVSEHLNGRHQAQSEPAKKKRVEAYQRAWGDPGRSAEMAESNRKAGIASSTPENIRKRVEAACASGYKKTPEHAENLAKALRTPEERKARSERAKKQWANTSIRVKMMRGLENARLRKSAPENHKVVAVRPIKQREDVYCVHVNHPTHRFALAAGVFVSNCWLMQRGMWERLIASMVEELCVNVDPCFRFLVEPPCFKAGVFQACPFPQSNNERIIGLDPNPPCPLYLSKHAEEARDVSENCFSRLSRAPAWQPAHGPKGWITSAADQNTRMGLERRAFQRLWRRDVDSGEPVG